MELFHEDRLDSPVQLPTMADTKICKNDASICVTSLDDEPRASPCKRHGHSSGREETATSLKNDAGCSFALRFAPRNSNAGRVIAIESKVPRTRDGNGSMTKIRESFADDDDFPPTDNYDVQVDRHRIVADIDVPNPAKGRESEHAMSSDDGSFLGADSTSDPSVDEMNKVEGDPTRDEIRDAVVVGIAQSVFHPKVINTNCDCSVSTIGGGYQRESCAGGTQLSKMSFRVLNPPHPICALQALDRLSLISVATQKKSMSQARQGRPKEKASFTSGPTRRLSFLHCR